MYDINGHTERFKIIRSSTTPSSLYTFCEDILKEMSTHYDVLALSSPGKELEDISRREGVPVRAVSMERHISPFKDLRSLWRLYRLFLKERPDMVHSMTPKAGLLCMIAARLARVPVRIHTFTGLIWPTSTGLKRRILIFTDKILCACATHINPEGRGVRDDMARQGITHKELKIIAYGNVRGINAAYYDPELPELIAKAHTLKRDDRVTFIFVGRLVGDKGINELVHAFDPISRLRPETRLILVGAQEPELDPLHPDTLRIIQSNPGIEAVGRQNDVRPWLMAADILAFPSYREGFPNVVLEGGAMGLPSIVTDINGSREIIENAFNGIIIKPRSTDELMSAMLTLVDDPVRRHKMASNARQHIISHWSTDIVRRGLYQFYEQTLTGLTPRSAHAKK